MRSEIDEAPASAVRAGKPHIYFRRRFWRVSPMGKPYYLRADGWHAAHAFVHKLNQQRLAGMLAKVKAS